MSNVISKIEYSTRAALVAAANEIQKIEGVVAVDIIDLGRTLRVVHDENATLGVTDATETLAEAPVATTPAPAAEEAVSEPSEAPEENADEDLIGETPPAKEGRRS